MKYTFDQQYFLSCLEELLSVPSPVGYYEKLNPVLERYAASLGVTVTYDNKSTAYITLLGEDTSKTVMVGAHADTIGMMVRAIDGDGKIRMRNLGGVNYANLEGETATVHTRDGREYTGLIACQSHSVHVFSDARTLPRDENTMVLLLDERVSSKSDIHSLGIRNGDYISVEPRFQYTEKGYIKARFIDDKAAVACCLTVIKYLNENNLKPAYTTVFAFPYGEEIGLGGTYLPQGVSEYVALDIGLIGPGLDGNEYSVSICAKDATAPYDYTLTNRLISLAGKAECDYAVDVFMNYGTDANAAMRAGNNIRAAAFGMAVYCSHGMERTHIDGIKNTLNLLLAYILDI